MPWLTHVLPATVATMVFNVVFLQIMFRNDLDRRLMSAGDKYMVEEESKSVQLSSPVSASISLQPEDLRSGLLQNEVSSSARASLNALNASAPSASTTESEADSPASSISSEKSDKPPSHSPSFNAHNKAVVAAPSFKLEDSAFGAARASANANANKPRSIGAGSGAGGFGNAIIPVANDADDNDDGIIKMLSLRAPSTSKVLSWNPGSDAPAPGAASGVASGVAKPRSLSQLNRRAHGLSVKLQPVVEGDERVSADQSAALAAQVAYTLEDEEVDGEDGGQAGQAGQTTTTAAEAAGLKARGKLHGSWMVIFFFFLHVSHLAFFFCPFTEALSLCSIRHVVYLHLRGGLLRLWLSAGLGLRRWFVIPSSCSPVALKITKNLALTPTFSPA